MHYVVVLMAMSPQPSAFTAGSRSIEQSPRGHGISPMHAARYTGVHRAQTWHIPDACRQTWHATQPLSYLKRTAARKECGRCGA